MGFLWVMGKAFMRGERITVVEWEYDGKEGVNVCDVGWWRE